MRSLKHRLKLYRRHLKGCTKSDLECDCPLWAYGYLKGKQWRHSLNTSDIATGQQKVREHLADLPAAKGKSIEETIELFLIETNGIGRESGTVYNYDRILRIVAAALSANKVEFVGGIETQHLTRIIHEVIADRKPRTKNQWMDVITNWLNFCVRQGFIPTSPAGKGRLRRIPIKRDAYSRKALTQDEVALVRAAIETFEEPRRSHMRALFLTLIFTGLRISDVLSLGPGHIDWRTGYLKSFDIKKTKKRSIGITLNPDVVAALRQLPQGKPKFFYNGYEPRSAYQRCTQDLVDAIQPVLHKRVTPHWMRDTFAVNLLKAGGDIYAVSKLLGHSSVKMTERYLSDTPQPLMDDALAKLQYNTQPQPKRAKLKRIS